MKKIVLLVVSLVSVIFAQRCTHEHEETIKQFQDEFSQYYFNDLYPEIQKQANLRKLQSNKELQNLRMTLDFTYLETIQLGITDSQKSYIKKISKIAASFIMKLIKVNPVVGKNIYNSKMRCIDIEVPTSAKVEGIDQSDLNLYVTYFNTGSSALANAAFCFINPIYQRPTFGRVSFNIGYLIDTNPNSFQFQLDLQVLLHEIIHVLGFSGDSMQYWIDPETNKPYKNTGLSKINAYQNIRGMKTLLLTSKNVAETARKHFNCSSLQGMQIENQGGSGSAGSHWERTVIMNELMTAQQVSIGATFSVFTIALLKDTGFWADVNQNLQGDILWGKNKGCDFFLLGCQSSDKQLFNEFVPSLSTEACSFTSDGFGKGVNDGFSDSCYYIQPYENNLCTNPVNQKSQYTDTKLESYSPMSRCFMSTLMKPGTMGSFSAKNRCHEATCSQDFSTVQIQITQLNITILCETPGKVKSVTFNGKKIGDIECPKNFYYFCQNSQQCPNHCSSNGLCINKVCICGQGYSGSDCKATCPLYQEEGNCVDQCSTGKFLNPDNTCKKNCPFGYFGDNFSRNCLGCDFTCSSCQGLPNEVSKNCQKCSFYKYLLDGNCIEKCPIGLFEDIITNECSKCQVGCATCLSQQQCTQCNVDLGYQLVDGHCIQLSCDLQSQCSTCQSSPNHCTSCKKGFYLLQSRCVSIDLCGESNYANQISNKCESCPEGCQQCLNSSECSLCLQGYRLVNKECTICNAPCKSCDISNKSKCNSCDKDYYLTSSFECVSKDSCPIGTFGDEQYLRCAMCSNGCVQCSSQYKCNLCDTNFHYQLFRNSICIQANDCFSPCSSCTQSFHPDTCSSCLSSYSLQESQCVQNCSQGYYSSLTKQGSICQKCSTDCLACLKTSTSCLSCQSGKVLMNNQCLSECPQGFIAKNSQCEKGFDDTMKNKSISLNFYDHLLSLIIYIFISLQL